jgi:hypothetical protein
MKTGAIQSLIDVLEQAFRNLGLDVPMDVLESLAITVHKAMSVEGRHYHTPEHVLSLSNARNPVQTLAALFHDIVYYQVDRGFSSEVMEIIGSYIRFDPQHEADTFLVVRAPADDLCFCLTMEVFGFSAGQKLFLTSGFNEFLSTLVMGKKLERTVPNKVLIQIMAYIEATIPFRRRDEKGIGPFEVLAERLRRVSRNYQIPMSEQEIDNTIKGAVVFANLDVDNFSEKDPAMFLDNTWKLLPETNLALRSGEIYSIREYRQALQEMEKSLWSIRPEDVFHEYRGAPPKEEYQEKLRYARRNITVGCEYLGIKLLTIAILEALADVTGGDAPLSLFMGDMRKVGEDERQLEDFLPQVEPPAPGIDPKSTIYKLLESGRSRPADFTDLKNSPLALFIYTSLGPEKAHANLNHAREMFEGKLSPAEFLQIIDPSILAAIAEASAHLVVTRSEKLILYARK